MQNFDTYDILKKRRAVVQNNPYIALENNKFELFDSEKINFSTITKDELTELGRKFNTEPENLVKEFFIRKKETSETSSAINESYQSLLSQIEGYEATDTLYDVKENLKKIDRYRYTNPFFNQDINELIKDRQKLLNKITEDLKKHDEILKQLPKSNINSTDFIIESQKVQYIYEYIDIYELFNSIVLSNDIPICVLKTKETVFKVYNNFKDFKLSQLFFKPKKHYSEYYISILYKGKSIFVSYHNNTVNIVFEVNDDEYSNTLLNAITIDKKLIEKKIISTKSFAITELSINKDIFLDIIMNVKPLYQLIYVDQSNAKNKEFISLKIVDRKNPIKYTLSDKKTGINDIYFKLNKLKIYQDYINIRIDYDDEISISDHDLQCYKNLFLSYVELYKQNFKAVEEDYKGLYEQKEIKSITKITTLKQARPDIFISGYARHGGQKKQQPVLYNEQEHKDLDKSRRFKYEELDLICIDEKDYKYPGLKENTLENKDKFPYLPVCYKESHDEDMTIYEQSGFQGLQDKHAEHKKGSSSVKNKAVEYRGIGELPSIISYIVNSNGEDAYRAGVDISPNSFIHAVLLAVDEKYSKSNDKENYVEQIRKQLDLNVSIQQNWDGIDSEEFDSSIYLFSLEKYVKKNIYILRSDDISDSSNKNVYFEIPRYTQFYIKHKRFDKSIMIYKHMGRFADALKSHHYELIMYEKGKAIFNDNTELGKRVLNYFNKCYDYYNYHPTEIENVLDLQHDAEIIDSYGKVRALLFKKYSIVYYTPPLAPSLSKSVSIVKDPYPPNSFENVKKFLHEKKLNITAKDVRNNKLIGVFINKNYIPIQEINFSEELNLPEQNKYGLVSKKSNNRLLQTFNNRKIADFIMQYALYAFSKSNKTVEEFIENNVQIIENNDFLRDLKRELNDSNAFYNNGFLILDSEKTKEKIKWYLKYAYANYTSKKYLDNFYIIPEDYKQQENVVISFDIKTVSNTLQTVDDLDPETKAPQFYMNWILSKNPILVQNTKNKEMAIAVSKNFMEYKYNLGWNGKPMSVQDIKYNEITSFVSKIDKNIPTIYSYDNTNTLYAAFLFIEF